MPSTRLLWFGVPDAAFYDAIVDIGVEFMPGYSDVVQPISSLYQARAVLGPPIAIASFDSEIS